MIERLMIKYGVNNPIFTNEILEEMKEYSRPRVFQLIKKAEQEKLLIKFSKGVYYIPTKTRFGTSIISVEQVVAKKYISNNDKVFGIYGGLQMKQNFMISYQIPTTIEVITNNETTWVRKIRLRNRNVILRKSRCLISKDNVDAYTILELFTDLDMKKYKEDCSIKKEIVDFIKKKEIKSNDLFKLVSAFPSKTIKNIVDGGILGEFA